MKTGKQRAFGPWVFTAIAVIFICGFAFIGCKDGSTDASVPDVAATGVTLDGDAEFTLAVGQNKILDYTVLPDKATNKAVMWASSDTEVAIASEGVIYAVGEGTATITVTTRSGYHTATCEVTVTPGIRVTGVAIEQTTLILGVGTSESLTPILYPENASNTTLIWGSFNQAVAIVSDGTVTGIGPGTTTINVITVDGYFEARHEVTVIANLPTGMVWIQPGTFLMGSPLDEAESYEDEVQHLVTLTEGFFMGEYPVTHLQYEAIMGERFRYFPDPDWDEYYLDRGDEFPTENVSWYETIVFCNLLSMSEGLSPAYEMQTATDTSVWSTDPEDWGNIPTSSSARWNLVRMVAGSGGYRLPTEAQWEYACRAGTTTVFNTGDTITGPVMEGGEIVGGQANYYSYVLYDKDIGSYYDFDDGVWTAQTVPVGLFEPNAWGLYDMHGNVNEWCWDWFGDNERGTTGLGLDPTGPATGTWRITRGGSYYDEATLLRSALRGGYVPQASNGYVGFRLVRPLSGAPVEESEEGEPSESRAKAVTKSGIVKMMQAGKIVLPRTQAFDRSDRTSVSPVRLQATRRNAVIVE